MYKMELEFRLVFGLIIWIINKQSVCADCRTVYPGTPTFRNCQYRCHCKNDQHCDNVTGECGNGCEFGWMGPACQYRNIAKDNLKVQNRGGALSKTGYANRAVDGNISTCCRTSSNNGFSGKPQYWKIQLRRLYHVAGLVLHIPEEDIGHFANFRVEYGDAWDDIRTVCYKHPDEPGSKMMNIMCKTPVWTQYMRVILGVTDVSLRLCEFEVYGGRDVSFNRQTSGAAPYDIWYAYKAVDGRFLQQEDYLNEELRKTCSAGRSIKTPWWRVDLGSFYEIQDIYYYGRDAASIGQMRGFTASVSNTTSSPLTNIYTDPLNANDVYQPHKTMLQTTHIAKYVILWLPIQSDTITICELQTFAECTANQCGWECTIKCHCNTSDVTGINKISGICRDGCKDGWTGSDGRCDECSSHDRWGHDCETACGNCVAFPCDADTGRCNGGCSGAWKPPMCLEVCDDGWYGQNCSAKCGNCRFNQSCNILNGICEHGCSLGWKHPLCHERCDNRLYGENCSIKCGNCLGAAQCNTVNGSCTNGCDPGYKGDLCKEECTSGFYGYNCNDTCGQCLNVCKKENGVCMNGCNPGYTGDVCKAVCKIGFYGKNCLNHCGRCLQNETCFHVNGTCASGCELGYQQPTCTEECNSGTFGLDCNRTCGHCKAAAGCDSRNGTCRNQCKPGYLYNDTFCQTECSNGMYGDNCQQLCGHCKDNGTCNHVTGYCECKVGYTGPSCKDTKSSKDANSSRLVVIAGSVSAAIILAILVVIGLVVASRRRKTRTSKRAPYANDVVHGEQKVPSEEIECVNLNVGEQKGIEEVDIAVYGNIVPDAKSRLTCVASIRRDTTAELTNPVKLIAEYNDLPRGLQSQYSTAAALKPNNRSKNRYKSMYPYDASRVKLPLVDGIPDSDYINASYIDGYHVPRKYIAAQGAIDNTVGDIWRMIWSEKINIIVMVTNLLEMGQMKCIQYWFDENGIIEDFEIKLKDEDVYANFVVRKFKCKKISAKQSRIITQYHFTAWPDKDVPDTALSLVQFWKKIRMSKEASCTPWMVHCSAGIGRTGTFIALDYLYDQGQTDTHISFNTAVATIREQRLNMVQTKEQYLYLHATVMEAVSPIGSVCNTDDFTVLYPDVSSGTTAQSLDKEYRAVFEETASCINIQSEERESMKQSPSAQLDENKSKSRNPNVFPDDLFRPRLITPVDGRNDFINAVFVSTFRKDKQLIMTQVPLSSTVVDFIRMIWEFEVDTVILVESKIEKGCCYWADRGMDVTHGPFIVGFVAEHNEMNNTKRTIKLTCKGKNESKEVNIFQFTQWSGTVDALPEPGHLLRFISDVQNNRPNGTIIVQCCDGVQRSGLFTVIWCVLDRMKTDGEVAIAETVRLVRTRRPQAIIGVEQYRYCHTVIHDYLEQFDVYVNAI